MEPSTLVLFAEIKTSYSAASNNTGSKNAETDNVSKREREKERERKKERERERERDNIKYTFFCSL